MHILHRIYSISISNLRLIYRLHPGLPERQQGKVVMKKVKRISAAVLLAAIGFGSCQHAFAECGIASTYSSGTLTANGERYDHMGISAAHKSLPFGTRVIVRNQATGRSITVRINDRGPFVPGRIIDLSTGAKNALGMDGLAPVCLEVESYGGQQGGFQNAVLRLPKKGLHDVQHAGVMRVSYRPRHVSARKAVRYTSYRKGRHLQTAGRRGHGLRV
jgi:rare lipoprotein A